MHLKLSHSQTMFSYKLYTICAWCHCYCLGIVIICICHLQENIKYPLKLWRLCIILNNYSASVYKTDTPGIKNKTVEYTVLYCELAISLV